MSEALSSNAQDAEVADLKVFVLRQIMPVFKASGSPNLAEAGVVNAANLFFDLLEHRIDDPNLDGVGKQILDCLRRRSRNGEHVKIADRFEPFAKFVLRLTFPARYLALDATLRNRFMLAQVLKELKLAEDGELKAWSLCPWQEFPPPDLPGKPDFKEQVGWTVKFRNTEDHLAPELDDVREAKLVQSVCVCLVWLTAKYEKEIRLALIRSRFFDHLQRVQDRFADIAARFVELTTESRSSEEYRFLDPLGPSPTATSAEAQTDASMLANANRVTVIEAEPGAGKTTTLKFVAWQHADRLLSAESFAESGYNRIPVYVELKLISHRGQTIEAAIRQELKPAIGDAAIPWDSLLLLVDGVNEIGPQHQTNFKAEIEYWLSRFAELRVVLTGRPNSFRGEFEARIVVLQRLSDQQLTALFRNALGDAERAKELVAAVRLSPFLSSWARTPLNAAMVVGLARQGGIAFLADHSTTVRRFIRGLLNREIIQASGQTLLLTKERLLARLAFETKNGGHLTFSKAGTLSSLGKAKAQVSATSIDLPKFIQEVLDNHLLQPADAEEMEFAHELYHDYFAAAELEACEQLKTGEGVELALSHFNEAHWNECVRLFAGFSKSSRTLVERGAEKNPFLAWQLLRDASDETPELVERVSGEAYCALSAELKSAAQATMAGACIFVLADLGRADLLEKAITEQREIFNPNKPKKLTDEQKAAAQEKQKQVAVPLANGLLLLVRLGLMEQKSGQEDRFCHAARSALRGLKRIQATRVLRAMLSAWNVKAFDPSSLVPGEIVTALMELGPESVLLFSKGPDDLEFVANANATVAWWFERACEAGGSDAWRVYGRTLRLAGSYRYPGITFQADKAFKWLRQSHEAGDSKATLELALLLLAEPKLVEKSGEGERMLRQLAQANFEARYELGSRLLKGENLPRNEAEGFKHLLLAAESGHAAALVHVNPDLLGGQFVFGPPPHIVLPPWAKPHLGRLVALFPDHQPPFV